jgi:hypothetical protein
MKTTVFYVVRRDPAVSGEITSSSGMKNKGCYRLRFEDLKGSDDTQNYWVSGLCSSSGILNTKKCNFLETGCFRPQVRGGSYLLCWVP